MENPPATDVDWAREHQIFWMLVKGARDEPVSRVYLAIQAAMAFDQTRADVGSLLGAMMAKGRSTLAPTQECIGGAGLAYFAWLFEVDLTETGEGDIHVYRFRRRRDGKELLATLRTSEEPRSLHFQQAQSRELRRLSKQRDLFLSRLQNQAGMALRTGP